MPFIHVAKAKSSKTLGPQASCNPADGDRVCNNADMAWDAVQMQYEGQQLYVYTLCTNDVGCVLFCQWLLDTCSTSFCSEQMERR